MTDYHYSTESKVTEAQKRLIGKFCTRCRRHRPEEGGATLKAGSGRTRWVCAPCLGIIKTHKRTLLSSRMTESYIAQRSVTKVRPIR